MNLTDDRLKQLDNPNLTPDRRALFRSRLAAEFIHTGQYETAREALGDLWQGIGNRPQVKGLSTLTTAEVLLQCGVLSGWLGSVRQTPDAQEKAKDLLFEASRLFQGEPSKVSEVQYELGMCYWRLGAYDESRVVLQEAVKPLTDSDLELKAKILIRRTLVEVWGNRYYEAWNILKEAAPVFESANDALKGRWHGQMALVLDKLGTAEGFIDYFDRAIMQYTAAIFHYEQAKHERYCATNLNNLAMLLQKLGRYDEAHENLNRAGKIFSRLKDTGNLAQVNETRARVLLAEHRYDEANHILLDVVGAFEHGSEYALLADALTLQGVVWARLGQYDGSLRILRHAVTVGSSAGANTSAGQASLALIEEHGTLRLSENEIYSIYRRADELLRSTQDAEDVARLRACARIMGKKLLGAQMNDKDFSLQKAVKAFEARHIEQALELEQGSVSRAARRLGMTHQVLGYVLRTRHKKLLSMRTPPVIRQKGVFQKLPKN